MIKFFDKFQLNEKVVIITGGAGLLGKKHAEAILEAGGTAVLIDIATDNLRSSVKDLSVSYPQKARGYVCDITNEIDVKNTIDLIENEVGNISVLINNAANNYHVKNSGADPSRLENFSTETWNKDIAVGLTGAFILSKFVGSLMAKRNCGVILNIASDLGIIAPDQRIYRKNGLSENDQPVKPVSYSVVKHGLIGLTKYLSTYWPENGVRVNSVSFGGVYNGQPDEFVKKLCKLIPLGRMASIDEYKSAIVFLCSDASSYMTGANLVIDGGRTVW